MYMYQRGTYCCSLHVQLHTHVYVCTLIKYSETPLIRAE